LRRLGRSRVLRTSYFWLIAIPLIANFFLKIGPQIKFRIMDSEIMVTFGLPFSWKMFYFSSVAFALASAIYSKKCPKIISEYEKYSDFIKDGRTQEDVKEKFLESIDVYELRSKGIGKEQAKSILDFVRVYCGDADITDKLGMISLSNFLDAASIQNEKLREAFWHVRKVADNNHFVSRVICAILYLIAFILVILVLCQNFIYVWRFV